MAHQTPTSRGKSRDELGTYGSQASTEADQVRESASTELISALPTPAVESRKKSHDEVIKELESNSSSTHPSTSPSSPTATSASSSALPLVSSTVPSSTPPFPFLDASDSTPLLASHPSTQDPPQQSHWMVFFPQWLAQCFGLRQAPQPPVTLQSIYDAIFSPYIQIEIDCGNGQYLTHAAIAMIDFHCEHNLINRDIGDLFFKDLDSADPYPLIATLGPDGGTGGVANAIKKIRGRWACTNNPTVKNPWLRFEKMMLDSEFHIMERGSRHYDIIIGARDIVRFDLLDLKRSPKLVASHFRSRPHPVDAADARAFDEATAAARQAESEDRSWMTRRHNHAQQYAQQRAQDYANNEVARLGPTTFRDAYYRAYDFYYAEGEENFQRNNPRPNRTT